MLHSHWVTPRGLAGALLAREFGLPHVLTLRHGALVEETAASWSYRQLVARILKSTDHVVAVSEPLGDMARRLVGPDRVSVIANGVDVEALTSLAPAEADAVCALRAESGDAALRVLFVGTDLPKKGFPALWEAWRRLAGGGRRVHLSAVGLTEDDRTRLTREAEAAGLSRWCRCHGSVDPSEMKRHYHAADVFVLPTLHEGFPNALIEAAACDTPVVATPVGGIPTFLDDGVTGLDITPGSADSVVAALTRLLDDDTLGTRLAQAAKRRLGQGFDLRANAGRLVAIYDRLLSRSAAEARR